MSIGEEVAVRVYSIPSISIPLTSRCNPGPQHYHSCIFSHTLK